MSDQEFFTGKDAAKSYAQQQFTPEDIVIQRGKATSFQTIGGYAGRTFVGHDTNISVRSDYNRGDYRYFRPSDSGPTNQLETIAMCMAAYDTNGIVKNIIDLMSEFASYGIRLQHPRKSTENFYSKWFNDVVHGPEISCTFVRLLLKAGNTIVKRNIGKIPVVDESEWKKAISGPDLQLESVKVNRREIPIRYTFINPVQVDMVGGEVANFIGKPILQLKVPHSLKSSLSKIGKLNDSRIDKLIKSIPADILRSLNSNAYYIPLDMDKIEIFYYKKEDWMPWGNPITASVLNDLIMLEKMKLADISALDGAISNIRLWTVGVLDGVNSILPSKSVINKIRNILANNVGGGVLDFVWGPELKFTESNSQVWRFLGSDKYEATLNAIYETFGVPPTLRTKGGGNNTGNYVSLNTMIKRLQYVRDILVRFWKGEITRVHKAMGFKGPVPRITFDNMVLADEAAEKQLLINLWDRDIIATESIREIFGRIPEVEQSRVKIEMGDRENDNMPEKASPFHNPDKEHELKKLLLQGGDVTPSEVGVELMERKEGEKTRLDQNREVQIELKKINPPGSTNKTGLPGRPNNVIETKKRKPKPTEKPSTNADLIDISIWATKAYHQISDIVTPALLYGFGKNNLRQLTKVEFDQIEKIKFGILCQLNSFEEINPEIINEYLQTCSKVNKDIISYRDAIKTNFKIHNCREPNTDEMRQICVNAFALFHSDN